MKPSSWQVSLQVSAMRMGPRRRSTAILVLLVVSAASVAMASERRATIFYTASVRGALEPCGCTSDPLGDITRMTSLIRRAGPRSRVLLVDAGDLLYPGSEVPPRLAEGADLRATFLARELGRLPFGGAAVGEMDLARGVGRVVPRRLAANLAEAPFLEPSRLLEVGGIRIGILGLMDPALARRFGWRAEEPVEAGRREATELRRRGAEVVIALLALDRSQARRVARTAPVDFIVVGQNAGEGLPRADAVGGAFILSPAEDLQKVGRIDLVLRDAPGPRSATDGEQRAPLIDAGAPEGRALEQAELARRMAQLDTELGRWAKDPSADPSFVTARRQEREELRARLAAWGGTWEPPARGSYFINRLIPLRRVLPRDPALARALRRLDQQVGAANLRGATPPSPATPDRPAFTGDRSCARCHEEAMAHWRTTVHAGAWRTIVEGGKTGFPDCVSCHVTGYGEVGGSSLGHLGPLKNVQCETCHGPGSLHVAAEGLEEPPAVRRQVPESTCLRCHNEKHSDTFDFVAYLRDVLGPGHGSAAKKKLGPGPTGHHLRSAALARARAAGRAQSKALE
jgi:hypothetical protein